MPANVQRAVERCFCKALEPKYTNHALRSCLDDRYGQFVPPPVFNVKLADVVEVEVTNGCLSKVVVRIPCASRPGFDLVAALCNPGNVFVTVKTCWLNEAGDKHATLDRSKYVAI